MITRPGGTGARLVVRRSTAHSAMAAAITMATGKQRIHKRLMIVTPSRTSMPSPGICAVERKMGTVSAVGYDRIAENVFHQPAIMGETDPMALSVVLFEQFAPIPSNSARMLFRSGAI
jgi:hypothetical protein